MPKRLLYRQGVLQDILTRTASAPQLTIVSPTPGQSLTETLVVRWQSSDAEGDALMANVVYSRDGGASWDPLAVRHYGTTVVKD